MGSVALSENSISWQEKVQENKNKKDKQKTSTQENKECVMLVKKKNKPTKDNRLIMFIHAYTFLQLTIKSFDQFKNDMCQLKALRRS